MRLKVDVYYDGASDVRDMIEGLDLIITNMMDKYVDDDMVEPFTFMFPLGSVTLTKELNPIIPQDCEEDEDVDDTYGVIT